MCVFFPLRKTKKQTKWEIKKTRKVGLYRAVFSLPAATAAAAAYTMGIKVSSLRSSGFAWNHLSCNKKGKTGREEGTGAKLEELMSEFLSAAVNNVSVFPPLALWAAGKKEEKRKKERNGRTAADHFTGQDSCRPFHGTGQL